MSSQALRYKNKPHKNYQDFSTSVLIKESLWTIPDERLIISCHKNGVPKKISVKNININGIIELKEAIIFVSSAGKIKTIASKSRKFRMDIGPNGSLSIKHKPIKIKKELLTVNL